MRVTSLILLPLFALFVIGAMIFSVVHSQDQALNKERTDFFKGVVQKQATDARVRVRDYALWNDAVEMLAEKKDLQWAEDNIGSLLFETYHIEQTVVLTPDNKVLMNFNMGSTNTEKFLKALLVNDEIRLLANDARSHSPKDFKSYGEWVKIDGDIYLVGAAALTSQTHFEDKVDIRTEAEKHVLFFFQKADQAYWNKLASEYNLPTLILDNEKVDGFKVKIQDRHGDLIQILVMTGKTDVIGAIFIQYGFFVFVLVLLLIAITYFAIKRSIDVKLAHDKVIMLNEEMDELVRVRTKELEAALIEAQAASKAKSFFLSSMSHEFRTPLNGILGFAQLMQIKMNKTLSDKEKEWLEHIIQSGQLLLALVSDVLDMAHVESGQITLELEKVQPREIFKECYDITSLLAKDKNVTLTGRPETDKFINVDRRRLKQIILNVMNNAIKYNVEGGTVVFGCREHGPDMVRLFVTDTGLGISEEDQKMIFEPFYRSASVANQIEGTGVGLPLVVRLTEIMGGETYLESKLGEGSTFYLDFPVCEAQDQAK
jgi:signal transduction histidine kinase